MNTVLSELFVEKLGLPDWLGNGFVLVTIISEGCLLFVAAQAGFIDGPRVLANMARDSWMPHWFGNLSERLSVHNGVMLMGFSALAALWFTGGVVTTLLVMYSINVFVTFSLSMIGMCRHWWELRHDSPIWKRRFALFLFGATMCVRHSDRQRHRKGPGRGLGDDPGDQHAGLHLHPHSSLLRARCSTSCSGSTACWALSLLPVRRRPASPILTTPWRPCWWVATADWASTRC